MDRLQALLPNVLASSIENFRRTISGSSENYKGNALHKKRSMAKGLAIDLKSLDLVSGRGQDEDHERLSRDRVVYIHNRLREHEDNLLHASRR